MIYLDYSATTPVNEQVLDSFNKATINYVGNANSLHELGINAKNIIDSSTNQIKRLLNVDNYEVVYTSGSSEANNLAIKGIALKYNQRGKHIITSNFEHSSIYGPLNYLQSQGYEISYVKHDKYGIIDLEDLKKLIRDDTILVSINAVNSEIGIRQPIEEIGKIMKNYPKCFFHVDATQAVGKININFENVDLFSFSAHKIYGLKGIGALVKRNNINIEPLIHGGKSTTIYRSGTPNHPMIASFAKALRLINTDLDKKIDYVSKLNNYLQERLNKIECISINSNNYCVPHILNISIKGIKAETFMHALAQKDIFVSTKSACNDEESMSQSVYNLTNNEELAKSSIRVSLSYLTTEEELDKFLNSFMDCLNNLQ